MKNWILFLLITFPVFVAAQGQYKPDRIIYAVKDADTLWMDDYKPAVNANGISVVFVHGGAFTGGDPVNQRPFAEGMRKLGYRVFVLKYRLYLKGKSFGCEVAVPEKLKAISTAVEDVQDASRFISDNSTILGVDTKRMFLSGSSAGAEAILQTLYNPFGPRKQAQKEFGIRYRGAMSFAGALIDLHKLNAEQAIPLLMLHGTNDQLVPYETAPHRFCKAADAGWMMMFGAKPIYEKMKGLNVPVVLYSYTDAGHEISNRMFTEFEIIDTFMQGVIKGSLKDAVLHTVEKK